MPAASCCLACASSRTIRLEFSSQISFVDYRRCLNCGHIWTEPKPGDAGESRSVTSNTITLRPKPDLRVQD